MFKLLPFKTLLQMNLVLFNLMFRILVAAKRCVMVSNKNVMNFLNNKTMWTPKRKSLTCMSWRFSEVSWFFIIFKGRKLFQLHRLVFHLITHCHFCMVKAALWFFFSGVWRSLYIYEIFASHLKLVSTSDLSWTWACYTRSCFKNHRIHWT